MNWFQLSSMLPILLLIYSLLSPVYSINIDLGHPYNYEEGNKKITGFEEREIQCPNQDDIYPCVCVTETATNHKTMDCSDVTTDSELRNIFDQEFPSPDMYRFKIYNSKINKLSPGVFGNKTFQKIYIDTVHIDFSLDIFDGMKDNVEELEFDHVPFKNFVKNFELYTKLDYIFLLDSLELTGFNIASPTITDLYIGSTNLNVDGGNFYYGPMPNLQYLKNYNSLSVLPPDTSGYPNLKELSIWSSQLTYLSGKEWATNTYLEAVYINNNQLEDIETGYLKVAKGGILHAGINELTTLDEQKWGNIFENASYIRLEGNPFECGCDIAWIIFGSDTSGTTYFHKMSGAEVCTGGVLFTSLDPEDYVHCSDTYASKPGHKK